MKPADIEALGERYTFHGVELLDTRMQRGRQGRYVRYYRTEVSVGREGVACLNLSFFLTEAGTPVCHMHATYDPTIAEGVSVTWHLNVTCRSLAEVEEALKALDAADAMRFETVCNEIRSRQRSAEKS